MQQQSQRDCSRAANRRSALQAEESARLQLLAAHTTRDSKAVQRLLLQAPNHSGLLHKIHAAPAAAAAAAAAAADPVFSLPTHLLLHGLLALADQQYGAAFRCGCCTSFPHLLGLTCMFVAASQARRSRHTVQMQQQQMMQHACQAVGDQRSCSGRPRQLCLSRQHQVDRTRL
jgi:hypothetical protein